MAKPHLASTPEACSPYSRFLHGMPGRGNPVKSPPNIGKQGPDAQARLCTDAAYCCRLHGTLASPTARARLGTTRPHDHDFDQLIAGPARHTTTAISEALPLPLKNLTCCLSADCTVATTERRPHLTAGKVHQPEPGSGSIHWVCDERPIACAAPAGCAGAQNPKLWLCGESCQSVLVSLYTRMC